MKALIVPRRSWSLLPALIGRYGYRFFLAVAVRLRSYDLADRWLGFLAPTVVIGILASFLASFVLGFALLLLPFGDLTFGDALLESGSSVFTLGFLASSEKPPLALDVVAAATGMIFVALTIGYLPSLYAEVKAREALVKQLEGWTGVPSWGPEILARLSLAGAVDRLPELYSAWDSWSARVADTHMKYPVLTHFRLPLARNHRLVSLLAVLDAAALDSALRPASTPASRPIADRAGELLSPGGRLSDATGSSGRRRSADRPGGVPSRVERLVSAGFPAERPADEAWPDFGALRAGHAPFAYQLVHWTIAAPAPWSGDRARFPDIFDSPDSPDSWPIG